MMTTPENTIISLTMLRHDILSPKKIAAITHVKSGTKFKAIPTIVSGKKAAFYTLK